MYLRQIISTLVMLLHPQSLTTPLAGVTVDQSSMTGESDMVKKNPVDRPLMLAGTKVRVV